MEMFEINPVIILTFHSISIAVTDKTIIGNTKCRKMGSYIS